MHRKLASVFSCVVTLKSIIAFFALGLVLIVNSQSITASYNSTGTFTVCDVAQTNNLRISNGNGFALTNPRFTLKIPTGGTYVPGSMATSTIGMTVSEFNITNLNQPVFNLSNLGASNNVDVTYQIQFGCGVIAFQSGGGLTKETLDFTYTGGSGSQNNITTPSTYNVLAASLSIIGATNTSYTANVGDTYTQQLTIRNGGLGCTNTAFIKLDRAGGTFSFSNPSIGTISNDTLFLSNANMPGGDGKWCNAEDVIVSYDVTVNNCTNLNRAAQAGWGCGGSSCQVSTATNSNVIISNTVPNLTIDLPNPDRNYCFDGGSRVQRIRIVNTGNGIATNFRYQVLNQITGCCGTSLTAFDSNWVMKDKNGVAYGSFRSLFRTNAPNLGFNGAACGAATGTFSWLMMEFNGAIPANDTVYLEINVYGANLACVSCQLDYTGWMIIGQKFDYKNACGTTSYGNGANYTTLVNYLWPRTQWSQSIPTDVSCSQTFNVEINYSGLSTTVKSGTDGRAYFAMKYPVNDFTINGPILKTGNTGAAFTTNGFTRNDTLFIPLTTNISVSGQIRIPFRINSCSGSSCGAKQFVINHLFWYDSVNCANAVPLKNGCYTHNMTVKCPTPCPPGGATPLNFTFERINFGAPDNDDNRIADASGVIDKTKVATTTAVNGDTIKGTWNIMVYPNTDATDPKVGQPFTNTYLDFEMGNAWAALGQQGSCGVADAGIISSIPNAKVTIYPTGGGAVINCTVSPTIIGTIAHYDFSSCKSVWNGGDSIVVEALFKANWPTEFANSGPSGSYQHLFTTNAFVYSTYVAQPTPTTAPIAQSTYTCDVFNANLTIKNVRIGNNGFNGTSLSGCNSNLVFSLGLFTVNNGSNAHFPFEVRNFGILDTVRIRLPQGMVYRPNSAVFNTGYSPGSATTSIPDSKIINNGTVIFITDLKSFFKPWGGTFDVADESKTWNFIVGVQPTCNISTGAIVNYNAFGTWVGNGVNTPLVWKHTRDNTINTCNQARDSTEQLSSNFTYTGPVPVFTGGGSVVTNTGVGSWTVQLQNQSNLVAASNSYFYIDPKNSFGNIVIREQPSNTIVPQDANGFYQLGNFAAAGSNTFTITADLNRCGVDSMKINYGWGCTGYPTTFTPQSCTQFTWLKASGYPASLDVTFDKVSSGTVALCTPTTFETVINSTLVGNLDNEVLKVVLPTGMNYVPGSVQVVYPVGGSYTANAYNPTIVGDTAIFAVNSLTGGVGLTGVGDLTKNQVRIRFDVQTACGYVSGNSLRAIVTGASVCGDPVPTVVKTSSAVNLTGAVATTQYVITETGPNSFSTCGSNGTITVTVKNTGSTTPPVNDSLTINLSNGLSYVAGSFVSIKNAPSPTAPVQNGNLLRWRIPSTVAPGDSMKFTINLSANSAGCGFNTMDLYATQSIALSCGAVSCSTPVITGRLISDTITTICCVDMQVNKTVSPNPVAAGGTAVYTVAVYNPGPGTATNVVVNDVLPAGVTPVSNTSTSGTWAAPDWTIPSMAAGQRDTIRFTVTANNATTSAISAGVNTAYIKSINNTTPEINRANDTSRVDLMINPNCTGVNAGIDQTACGNTSATITGTPTTGTWTALGTNPSGASLGSTTAGVATVSFTAAANGNYDFILSDGSCKDTMRIVVTAKPNAGTDKTVDCYVTGVATMTATGTGTWSAMAGNAGTATITTPASATTTITGFSVAGTYNFIWSINGCNDTVQVIVNSNCTCPIANNSLTTTSSTQCTPYSATISGTTATPLTNTNYVWQVNSGAGWVNAGTTQNLATGTLAAGTYQYRRIFNHTGVPACSDTTAPITITVNAKPNAGTDITGVCGGSTVALTATPAGGNWAAQTGNPAGATLAGSNVSFTNASNGTYNFIYTLNGCTDTVAVVVNAKPNAGANHFYECGTQPATDTLIATPAGGTWAALSTNATGTTLTGNVVTLPAAPTQGSWNFVYTAPNGCTDTVAIIIGVNGNPAPAVNMGTNPICKNGTVQLCPTVWGWANYQWYKNGVAIAAPQGTASCITLDSTGVGSYTLRATNGSGCWSDASAPIVVTYDNTCTAGNGSVTSGGSGGVETKTLGNVIASRLFGNAIHNVNQEMPKPTAAFIKSGAIVNGPADLKLSDLVPTNVIGTDRALISTPTDLINFTNALEVLSVDYTKSSINKAVVFGTRTLGDVYSHTKPICDRLKGAELLEVKTINVNGFSIMAYQVRQRTGEVEYAMNLNAGVKVGRSSITVQSNWFTDSYVVDETMFNFQLWAISYDMVGAIAKDIISKLQQTGTVQAVSSTDLPKAYVSKGNRASTKVNLTVQNNTTSTTGYFELREKQNEGSVETVRTVPFTVAANKATSIEIPVQDYYEGSMYMYLGGKLTDLLYLSDGTWSVEYNKSNTTISQFTIQNELNPQEQVGEHRLLRNVQVQALTKDYISVYKTINGGGIEQDLSKYKGIKFTTDATGLGQLKVTIVKKGIQNWADQYSYTLSIDGTSKEYAIGLSAFRSATAPNTSINPNDVLAVNFGYNNTRGSNTNATINLSKVRFTTADIATQQAVISKMVSVYPNPVQAQNFTANFVSEEDKAVILRIVEIATGKTVKIQFVQAKKGQNQVNVQLDRGTMNGMYNVQLQSDSGNYEPQKLMVIRK